MLTKCLIDGGFEVFFASDLNISIYSQPHPPVPQDLNFIENFDIAETSLKTRRYRLSIAQPVHGCETKSNFRYLGKKYCRIISTMSSAVECTRMIRPKI